MDKDIPGTGFFHATDPVALGRVFSLVLLPSPQKMLIFFSCKVLLYTFQFLCTKSATHTGCPSRNKAVIHEMTMVL